MLTFALAFSSLPVMQALMLAGFFGRRRAGHAAWPGVRRAKSRITKIYQIYHI